MSGSPLAHQGQYNLHVHWGFCLLSLSRASPFPSNLGRLNNLSATLKSDIHSELSTRSLEQTIPAPQNSPTRVRYPLTTLTRPKTRGPVAAQFVPFQCLRPAVALPILPSNPGTLLSVCCTSFPRLPEIRSHTHQSSDRLEGGVRAATSPASFFAILFLSLLSFPL